LKIQTINSNTIRVDFFTFAERLFLAALAWLFIAITYFKSGNNVLSEPIFWLLLVVFIIIMLYQRTLTISGITKTICVQTLVIPYILDFKKFYRLDNLGDKQFYVDSYKVYDRWCRDGRTIMELYIDVKPGAIRLKKISKENYQNLSSFAQALNQHVSTQLNQSHSFLEREDIF
jgi:hypothetical protein